MRTFVLAIPLLIAATPTSAAELIGGLFVHDVDTPFNKSGQENGADIHVGWRGGRIDALKAVGAPAPHVYLIGNTSGGTSFAVAGIDWKIGKRVYLRPGIGLAVHNGPRRSKVTPDRINFGSRVLFAPEVALGTQIGARTTVELSWVHFSHASLFSRQNPGTDSFGLRLNFRY